MQISQFHRLKPEAAIPIGRPFLANDTVFSKGLKSIVRVMLSPWQAGEAQLDDEPGFPSCPLKGKQLTQRVFWELHIPIAKWVPTTRLNYTLVTALGRTGQADRITFHPYLSTTQNYVFPDLATYWAEESSTGYRPLSLERYCAVVERMRRRRNVS